MRAAIIRLACVALVSYVAGSMAVTAQSEAPATPKFEVASVKLHTSDDRRVMMVAQPGGRFVAANVPLKLGGLDVSRGTGQTRAGGQRAGYGAESSSS